MARRFGHVLPELGRGQVRTIPGSPFTHMALGTQKDAREAPGTKGLTGHFGSLRRHVPPWVPLCCAPGSWGAEGSGAGAGSQRPLCRWQISGKEHPGRTSPGPTGLTCPHVRLPVGQGAGRPALGAEGWGHRGREHGAWVHAATLREQHGRSCHPRPPRSPQPTPWEVRISQTSGSAVYFLLSHPQLAYLHPIQPVQERGARRREGQAPGTSRSLSGVWNGGTGLPGPAFRHQASD